jgi:hypothetical protein
MSKRECPSCGIEVDTAEKFCPICQYEFPEEHGLNIKLIAFVLLLLLIYPFIRIFC